MCLQKGKLKPHTLSSTGTITEGIEMGAFLRDGIIFSAAILLAFAAINLFLLQSTTDYAAHGFPFPYYEGWGPCPSHEPGACTRSAPQNIALDAGLGIAIGFGIAFTNRKIAANKNKELK